VFLEVPSDVPRQDVPDDQTDDERYGSPHICGSGWTLMRRARRLGASRTAGGRDPRGHGANDEVTSTRLRALAESGRSRSSTAEVEGCLPRRPSAVPRQIEMLGTAKLYELIDT